MFIWLYDARKQETNQYPLKVEYSTPANDLMIVFYDKGQSCEFSNGKESAPYDLYVFKQVSHIVQGDVDIDGETHSLTLAYYMGSYALEAVVIHENSSEKYMRFRTSDLNDYKFRDFIICNYREYCEISSLIDVTPMSFRDFIAKRLESSITENQFSLYNLSPNSAGDFKSFVPQADFEKFLDGEEKRTSQTEQVAG